MSVRVSCEAKRGCGFRQPGGTYLVSNGIGIDCDLLPVELTVCPVCHGGIKPSRGWTWVEPDPLLPHHATEWGVVNSDTHPGCPLNAEGLLGERCGLLWIGEAFYATPHDWIAEGKRLGFSRRIPAVPRGFKVGETWVLTAHRHAIVELHYDEPLRVAEDGTAEPKPETKPGIFHIWMPSAIEYVVTGDETDERLAELEARGLDLVQVIPCTQTEMEAA
jgi:hypothetical protein